MNAMSIEVRRVMRERRIRNLLLLLPTTMMMRVMVRRARTKMISEVNLKVARCRSRLSQAENDFVRASRSWRGRVAAQALEAAKPGSASVLLVRTEVWYHELRHE